jgi:hypothetical protein
MTPKSEPATASKKSISPESPDSQENTSQENTSQENPNSTSQDSRESTSPDSPDKKGSTSPESKNQPGSTKIRNKEKEILKPKPTIKKIPMYPSGTLRVNQSLVHPAEPPINPRNLPHKLKKTNQNPNQESSKPKKSPSPSQPVMTAQEEEELSDAAEERPQLKKAMNDCNLL